MMVVSRRPAGRRRTLPPAGPRRRPGGVLICIGGYLGLLLVMPMIPT
jgi:hypothetical protein